MTPVIARAQESTDFVFPTPSNEVERCLVESSVLGFAATATMAATFGDDEAALDEANSILQTLTDRFEAHCAAVIEDAFPSENERTPEDRGTILKWTRTGVCMAVQGATVPYGKRLVELAAFTPAEIRMWCPAELK